MNAKKLSEKHGVNIMKIERPIKNGVSRSYWIAFLGGNGTGEPVIDIAKAYTLQSLAGRIEQAMKNRK